MLQPLASLPNADFLTTSQICSDKPPAGSGPVERGTADGGELQKRHLAKRSNSVENTCINIQCYQN